MDTPIDLDALTAGKPLIYLYALSPKCPSYQSQIEQLQAAADELAGRGIALASIFNEGRSAMDGNALDDDIAGSLRNAYTPRADRFQIVLVGPAGNVLHRDDAPLLTSAILRYFDSAGQPEKDS